MRSLAIVLLVGALAGCTSLHRVGGTGATLEEAIASRGLLKVGDHVRVTTTDGATHDFTIAALSSAAIAGARIRVSLRDIEHVEKRYYCSADVAYQLGTTAALAAGMLVAYRVVGARGGGR